MKKYIWIFIVIGAAVGLYFLFRKKTEKEETEKEANEKPGVIDERQDVVSIELAS